MWGSVELMCCINWFLYSAFWMTEVSSTYLSTSLVGQWQNLWPWFQTLPWRLATMGLMGNSYSWPMILFIILTLEEETFVYLSLCKLLKSMTLLIHLTLSFKNFLSAVSNNFKTFWCLNCVPESYTDCSIIQCQAPEHEPSVVTKVCSLSD